ncbi:MAG: type II toxin-antitoxin system PemK/MazF family toxin [Solirubrobacterales bacterium]
MSDAAQGEVWFCDLEPTRGREQAGRRPVLVVSVDQLGTGPSGLAIVVPLTTTPQQNPIRPEIPAGEAGLRERSWALPDMVRSVDRSRLTERWGRVRPATLEEVAARVRLLIRT